MQKKIIFSIIMIVIVLGVVMLSQQAYSRGFGKNLVSDATNQAKTYMIDGINVAKSAVYPKISGEVQNGGDAIKTNVTAAQQKVSENISQKISNYVSGVATSVMHPGTPQNCQPASTTSAAQ